MTTIVKDSYTLMLGDCLERMREIPDGSVDLVLTSPPYDSLRTYNDSLMWTFEIFKAAANEVERVLKAGGVCVWVVGDATHDGSETGTSFRQALYFKELGLKLHDTMIYQKLNPVPLTHNRYEQEFEYMFVLVKGKLAKFNPLKTDCKYADKGSAGAFYKTADAVAPEKANTAGSIRQQKQRSNIWGYLVGSVNADKKFKHPAKFPLQLAIDHVASWSNPGDLVLDPFVGSGTSGEAALQLGRRFIGIEKQHSYFEMAAERLSLAQSSGTTSDSTQSPADLDDSEPSAHDVSAVPGSC